MNCWVFLLSSKNVCRWGKIKFTIFADDKNVVCIYTCKTCILRNELKWTKVSVTICMLLSTEIKKSIIECHFLGLSDKTKNQHPAGNVRKCANASIMWLIFDNVSTAFLFNVALSFPRHMHALMQKKSFPGGREGGVWRILDYTCISFWCRATDLQLLKRELNFAIKILFILLVDRSRNTNYNKCKLFSIYWSLSTIRRDNI